MESARSSFEEAGLRSTEAHGPTHPILSARMLDRPGGDGCLFIDLSEIPPGGSVGMHTHGLGDEEIYVVIEGSGQATMDGERFAVGPGHVLINRPGGAHGLENDGQVPLRIVVIDVAVPGG
jgi:quercetin dioxygenase-like cupin family protein